MAAFSEDGSEWSECGFDEELHRDISSLREVLANDADYGGGGEGVGERPLEGLKLCLQKNQQLQALLQHHLRKIERALAENRRKQNAVRVLARSAPRKPLTLAQFRRSSSYFKDHKGRSPPFSFDVLRPRNGCPRNFYIDSFWRPDKEDKKLMSAVQDQCIELKSQPLQRKLKNTQDPSEQRELRRQITELKHLPEEELIADTTSKIYWDKLAFESMRTVQSLISSNSSEFDSVKSDRDCQLHWENELSPAVNSQPWGSEEDKLLLSLAQTHQCHNWHIVARELETNRTAFACLKRYQQSLNPNMIKSGWTEEEDEALRRAIAKNGDKNWNAVATIVGGNRTPQQCLHRWKNSLHPGIKKGRWSPEEDEQLREAVELFGVGNWSKIRTLVSSRTAVQCRERWVNILDGHINRGPWTKEDDEKLIELCSQYQGPISWSKVASKMGNRTDRMCTCRWKQLSNAGEILTQYTSRVKQREVLMNNFHGRRKHRSALSSADIEDDLLSETAKEKLKSYQKKISKRRKHDDSHPDVQQPNGDATSPFQSALLDLDNGSELHVSVSKSDACSQTVSCLSRSQSKEISQVSSSSTSSLLTPSQPVSTPASEPSQQIPTPASEPSPSQPRSTPASILSQPISSPASLSLPSPASQASQFIPSPASESSRLLCSESSLPIPSPASESSQLLSSESSLLTPSPASESSLLVPQSTSMSSSQLIATSTTTLCDMEVTTDATTVVSQKAPEHTVPSKRKSNKRRRKSWGRRKRKRSSVSSSTDDTDEVVKDSDKACSSAALPPTSVETSASKHTVNSTNDFAEFSGYHSVIAPQPSRAVFTQLSQLPRYRYLHKYLSQAYRRIPKTSQITAVQSATTTATVASNSETVMCSSATMYDRASEFIQQYERAGFVNNLGDGSSVPQPSGRMFTDLSQVPKQQYMYKYTPQVAVQTSISTDDTVVSVSSATSSTGTRDAATPDNYSTASNSVSLSTAQNLDATPQRCNMYLHPPTPDPVHPFPVHPFPAHPFPAHPFPAHPFPGTYPDYAYIAAMRYHQRYSFPLSSSVSASPYYFHNAYPSASIPHHMPAGYSGTSGYGGYGSTGLTSRNSVFASNTAAIASDSITPSPMLPEPVLLIDTPVTTTTCSVSHSTHIQSTSKCQAITSLPTGMSQPSTSGILTDEDPDSDHIAVAVSALLDLNSAPVLEPVDITITSTPPPATPTQSISTTTSDSAPLPVVLTSTVTSSSIPPPVVSIQTRISTGIDVGVGTFTQPLLTPNISTPISVPSTMVRTQASTATTTSPVAPIHTTGAGSVGVCYSVSPMQGQYGPNNVTNTIGRCISSIPHPSSETDSNSILAGTLLPTHPHSAANLEHKAGGNGISTFEDTSRTVNNSNVDKYSHQTASRCMPLSNLLQVSKSKPRVRRNARTSQTGSKCTAAVSMWQYYDNVERMKGTLLIAREVEPACAQSEVVIVRLKNSAYCQRK